MSDFSQNGIISTLHDFGTKSTKQLEKELLSSSGNNLDYYSVKATSAIDFRANNDKNLESLEKNSLDFYTSVKSICIYRILY